MSQICEMATLSIEGSGGQKQKFNSCLSVGGDVMYPKSNNAIFLFIFLSHAIEETEWPSEDLDPDEPRRFYYFQLF